VKKSEGGQGIFVRRHRGLRKRHKGCFRYFFIKNKQGENMHL